jgi:superfamily II DNA or RNA helicase
MAWEITFQDGTLVVRGASVEELPVGFVWDARIEAPRGPAFLYPEIVLNALSRAIEFRDQAREWALLDDLAHVGLRKPRDYQSESLDAWHNAGRRGTVVLPTGAGKTFVAEMAILETSRPTLVVTPTLDLLGQWHDRLAASFEEPIGILGGGYHEIKRITVTTYDSAYIHMGRYGNYFGLLVFDEVHHLPAFGYLESAKSSMAPFRLGLTATYERLDGGEERLDSCLGPVVYRKGITELAGTFLADYEAIRILVELQEMERMEYQSNRELYSNFIKEKKIYMSSRNGWNSFIRISARSKAGRAAFKGFLKAKQIAHRAEEKFITLDRLLKRERGRRIIIFTHDNRSAYRISTAFLIPCITHQTDVKERRMTLKSFDAGEFKMLVTSRVLNEGVDIQHAEVAIVMSGTGTVREHVQRLGRILRPAGEKHAILYELVAKDTTEEQTSRRRRAHDAYR